MRQWDIEVNQKMYEVMASIFQTLGLNIPSSITSTEMEKVLLYTKLMVSTTNKPRQSKDKTIPDNFKILDTKLINPKSITNTLVISKLAIVRYQLKTILQAYNVNVITVEDKFAGLADYVKKLYDLVIIDITDNFKDSFEVIREVKRITTEQSANTVIFAVTNYAPEPEIKDALVSRGVDKIIEKRENWYYDVVKEIKQRSRVSLN